MMKTRTTAPAALVGLALLLTGCELPTSTAASTEQTAPAGGDTTAWSEALEQLAALKIAPEDTGAHYDRDDWPHWRTEDGCTTREQVLIAQGVNLTGGGHGSIEVDPETCAAEAGGGNVWTSIFDDEQSCPDAGGQWADSGDKAGCTFTDPGDLDVDHLVPLEEMARSHTRGWSEDLREQYANDENVLWAVSASSNRSKGSQDPAEWLPPAELTHCFYAYSWVQTKTRYSEISGEPVTVDQDEHDALESVLTTCTGSAA